MIKIPCLFVRDFHRHNSFTMRAEITPGCEWALDPATAIATRKWDGTACAIIGGELFKRYDCKKGKPRPEGAIPCGEPDPVTGHDPVWVKCVRGDPNDARHFEAFDAEPTWPAATYELIGPKVNGNREKVPRHMFALHGGCLLDVGLRTFDGIRAFLEDFDGEGIVFHGLNEHAGKMCKVRRADFGLPWPKEAPA